MFGRRRIRQLEAENKVLREALDWYAVNENWKRRSTHPKGSPVRWEMSPAQKDHGGRARMAILKARSERSAYIGFLARVRSKWHTRRALSAYRDASAGSVNALWEKQLEEARKVSVTVPPAKSTVPDNRLTGEIA